MGTDEALWQSSTSNNSRSPLALLSTLKCKIFPIFDWKAPCEYLIEQWDPLMRYTSQELQQLTDLIWISFHPFLHTLSQQIFPQIFKNNSNLLPIYLSSCPGWLFLQPGQLLLHTTRPVLRNASTFATFFCTQEWHNTWNDEPRQLLHSAENTSQI